MSATIKGEITQVTVAGDQSTPGRYAVMSVSPDKTQLWVFLTEDYGNTWSKAVAAQAPKGTKLINERPTIETGVPSIVSNRTLTAIKYSNKGGQLAILWRAVYPDNSFDVWSSFSNDGGKTFKPLRVSNTTSPPKILERSQFLVHEDYWELDLNDKDVHYVYTGSQPGFLATWYARVPISAYLSK